MRGYQTGTTRTDHARELVQTEGPKKGRPQASEGSQVLGAIHHHPREGDRWPGPPTVTHESGGSCVQQHAARAEGIKDRCEADITQE